tara:strand:- start:449 stop:1312 length:864 start_codon:yes stop_codon:yes gene_type:complete
MNLQSDIKIGDIKKGLYVVSTPIGNLNDITLRAIKILKKSDYILCEDTRVSRKLLSHFNINGNLLSNHKFNEKKNINNFIKILKRNKIVSIISDAGTPTISDPGRILIKECINNKIDIYPIPGPSAVTAAISVSGFSDKYYFYGFLPEKKSKIDKDFKILSKLDNSIIFFISAKKINKIIYQFKKYFLDRDIVVCKEISKYFEEYFRSSVQNLFEFKKDLKGEITVVISEKKHKQEELKKLNESDKKKIKVLIKKLSIKDIIKIFVDEKDVSKKEIYNYCLFLKNEN